MEVTRQIYDCKETRLDLDPATQSSFISHRLPTAPSASTSQKRSQIFELPIAEDENAFRQNNLATAASIYHRIHYDSPRSFLWRVLEDGKVLSIRAVDVSRQKHMAEANLTLRLIFPQAIRPGCVAFSDSSDHDVLSVFVLTESRYVYTLSLRPDYFQKASSIEDNIGDWCKMYLSPSLSFKHVHRMVALTADQLFLAFHDGALLKLERISGGDGLVWKETHHSENGWSHTIRSMIPLGGTSAIRYGNQLVELSTATSIAAPATVLDNSSYAFMVSVDHQLRIWNLSYGKLIYVRDILNQDLEANDHGRKIVDPSQSQLVKVLSSNEETALCVTYSPLAAGEFKFWDIRPVGNGSLQVSDMFPHNKLVPQAPSSEIWTLADFSIVRDESDRSNMSLWALWKNNMTHRLLRLDFRANTTVSSTGNAWAKSWRSMAGETLRETPFPSVFLGDPSDTTDKWLHYILYPGRFTSATLETAIALFGERRGAPKETMRRDIPIPDRLCSAIAPTVSLNRNSDGGMNYEQFRHATNDKWLSFCRLLLELDKQRGEALSLVIDPEGEMPWVVLADGIAAVRDCSSIERIWHGSDKENPAIEHVARPLSAASTFRNSFSEHFLHSCKTMLLQEVLQEPSMTAPTRLRLFYDKCDFANQVSDDDYTRLSEDLKSFKSLTPQVYNAILELMDPSRDFDKRSQNRPLGEFGNKLVVKGVQETVELHRNICLDQIILLVLIEAEVNHVPEEGNEFDTAAVYSQLIKMLKRLDLIHWLVSTQISLPIKKSEQSSAITGKTSLAPKKPLTFETITILQGVMRHLFDLDLRPRETMSSVITEVIVQICAPNSEYEAPTSVIQCFLLKHDRPDLALEFSQFAGSDPFSVYIQGRTHLAANDPLTAAALFKKAAFGIAYLDVTKRAGLRSAGYLDEIERNLLNAGIPEYYSHIVALFDKEKMYSYVIDFARLALQFIKPKHGPSNIQVAQLRTEMHSRLFNAALHTSRYELAHSFLALFTDPALQQSSLRALIQKMCESLYASQLIELPFIGLQDQVDEILAQKCQGIVDVNVGVQYHKILYSWRIKRGDFRGAAAISLERLQRLQQSGEGDTMLGDDGLDTPVTKQFIALINALSCVDPKQAWILSEEVPSKNNGVGINGSGKKPTRKVVTLDDVRRSYQAELDRIAAIQNNQFAFVGGDEMNVL